jgi:hypothetical protein
VKGEMLCAKNFPGQKLLIFKNEIGSMFFEAYFLNLMAVGLSCYFHSASLMSRKITIDNIPYVCV